jgi:predicted transcriptional regulator
MKKPKAATKPAPPRKPFSVRLAPDVRAALDKMGKAEDRPAAYIAQRFIVEGLKAGGLLK